MSEIRVWKIVPLRMVTTSEQERDKWIAAGHEVVEFVSIDRIAQLETELAEAKKSIKSVIQHYEDGAVYFERNYEAFYTDSFQDLMVDIYKKHDEAAKESSK